VSTTARVLLGQYDVAWKLAWLHLQTLTTEECLWRPADRGLHVHATRAGGWRADWPDSESYDMGPPSIAWLTWHMGYWWSMALDHSFGERRLSRDDVHWPGSAESVRAWLTSLHDRWRLRLGTLTEADLESAEHAAWPYVERPLGDVLAWLNVELTKNAAEIGYARFLYAVRA
jgi:DinB family protein